MLPVRRAPGAAWLALWFGLGAQACAPRASLEPAAAALAEEREPDAPHPSWPAVPSTQPLPGPLTELLQRVAAVRGIEPGSAPALVALSARQLAQRASEQVARDVPEVVRRAQAQLLWRLGLVQRDFELTSALEAALAGQLQAFYAADPPTIFIDRALAGPARERALAHELVHALQDRQHALVRRLEYAPDAWDRQSALHALAEADALAVVERMGLADLGRADSAGSAQAFGASLPGVLTRALAAPYLDGRARLSELLAQGGFAAVDAALHDPPPSSHELLHGARTSSGVALPAFTVPGPGFRLVYSDVPGEQSLRSVLEEWADETVAAELASGWAADRVSTFVDREDTALVWELCLDRPERAVAIAGLLRDGLHLAAMGARGQAAPPVTEWSCGAHSDSGVVAVARRAARLVFASFSEAPEERGCASLRAWLQAAGWAGDRGKDLGP